MCFGDEEPSRGRLTWIVSGKVVSQTFPEGVIGRIMPQYLYFVTLLKSEEATK